MDNRGVKINPRSGRPLDADIEEQNRDHERREEEALKAQAAWLNMTQTEAGAMLVAMIREQLEKRFMAIATADPEASAYIKILNTLGVDEGLARAAVHRLMDKALKKEERK